MFLAFQFTQQIGAPQKLTLLTPVSLTERASLLCPVAFAHGGVFQFHVEVLQHGEELGASRRQVRQDRREGRTRPDGRRCSIHRDVEGHEGGILKLVEAVIGMHVSREEDRANVRGGCDAVPQVIVDAREHRRYGRGLVVLRRGGGEEGRSAKAFRAGGVSVRDAGDGRREHVPHGERHQRRVPR